MHPIRTAIKSVLIVDPVNINNRSLVSIFKDKGIELEISNQHQNYQYMIESKQYDCVMLNSELENNYCEIIIDFIKTHYPGIIIVILLEDPTYEKIFNFVRKAADDFILTPYTWEDIEKMLRFYYY